LHGFGDWMGLATFHNLTIYGGLLSETNALTGRSAAHAYHAVAGSGEVFFAELNPEPGARPAEQVEKLDTRQTEHLSRFARGDAFVGIEFDGGVLFDRANVLGFDDLVEGAAGNLQLYLQLHGTFIVPLLI
jgi:hypothetical protein